MKRGTGILLSLVLLLAPGITSSTGLSPNLHRRLSDIREQMDAGRHRKALPGLRQLLTEARGDSYAEAVLRQHLGYAYLETEELTAARRELAAALESKQLPKSVNRRLHHLLAQVWLRLEQPQQALVHLEAWLEGAKALEAEERVMAAQIYYAAERKGTAIAQLEKALSLRTTPPESWLRSLLAMYLETDRYKQAKALLRKLIRRNPTGADYWRHLAQLEARRGRQGQALAVLALAYRQGLLKADELTRFARLHAAADIPEKAARLLQQWRQSGKLPGTRGRMRIEADLWIMAREREPARALLRRLSKNAKDGQADFKRGRILFDQGRWHECTSALRQSLERGGLKQQNQARLLLGIAAFKAGDSGLAQTSLKQAMQVPDTRDQAAAWLQALAEQSGSLADRPTEDSR